MSNSMKPASIYFDSNPLLREKNTFFDNRYEGEGNGKYRNIPVNKTFESLEISDALFENACGGKEVKNIGNMVKSNYYANRNPVFGSKSVSGFPKQLAKQDIGLVLKTIQRKLYSNHGSINRMGQGSLSEPTLTVAKDRGDSVPFQDMYEDSNFSTSHFGDGKNLKSEDQTLKECIYFKKGGKLFQVDAGDVFGGDSKKHGKNESLSRAISKKKQGKFSTEHIHELLTNSLKLDNGNDDSELPIILSALKKILIGRQKKQANVKTKQTEKDTRQAGKGKNKHDIRRIKDKRFEMGRKSYRTPLKMLNISQPNNSRYSGQTYTVLKSPVNFDFSSKESDSEYEYDENENVVKRRPKVTLNRVSGTAKDTMKTDESGKMGSFFRSTIGSIEKARSKLLSQSSVSQCTDMYRFPKLKISDETLWENFKIIFRNYASTPRHSGEVISKKISTLWMTNAGVVDELLTEKDADVAFRNAAGAKITMNTREYKGFLIMLSLRMKLPYYEIYRRMCGIKNRRQA